MPTTVNIQADIAHVAGLGVLDSLLADFSTGKNIVWASAAYEHLGSAFAPEADITADHTAHVRTRAEKQAHERAALTKAHAEVFTPPWVCARMIDDADAAWWEAYEGITAAPEHQSTRAPEHQSTRAPEHQSLPEFAAA